MASQKVVVDLTNYKNRSGDRVDPGTYTAAVEDFEITTTRNDDAMFNVFLRIVGGEFDGSTIIDRLVQIDNSLFRTVNFLEAIGLPTPRKRIQFETAKVVGRQVMIEVDDGNEYRGRIKSEVRAYYRVRKQATPTEDATDLDGLGEFASSESSQNGSSPAPDAALPASQPSPTPSPAAEPEQAENGQEPAQQAESGAPEVIDLETIDL